MADKAIVTRTDDAQRAMYAARYEDDSWQEKPPTFTVRKCVEPKAGGGTIHYEWDTGVAVCPPCTGRDCSGCPRCEDECDCHKTKTIKHTTVRLRRNREAKRLAQRVAHQRAGGMLYPQDEDIAHMVCTRIEFGDE